MKRLPESVTGSKVSGLKRQKPVTYTEQVALRTRHQANTRQVTHTAAAIACLERLRPPAEPVSQQQQRTPDCETNPKLAN
jgi:hypothetical protein